MYIRSHDAGRSGDWREFVLSHGFGQLAVSGDGPVPVIVPTQFALDGDQVLLHLAKPNPVFEAIEATPNGVLSVAGDWAYIPGAWRAGPDQDPAHGIPTTYYGAVQMIGPIAVVDDADEVADILRTQLRAVEPHDGGLADPTVHLRRFPAIRGLRLTIEDVRSKYKYGANADAAQRERIVEALLRRDGPGDRAAAARVPRG